MTMTIRTDQIALLDFFENLVGAPPRSESRDVREFRGAGSMVEVHLPRVKGLFAVKAGRVLGGFNECLRSLSAVVLAATVVLGGLGLTSAFCGAVTANPAGVFSPNGTVFSAVGGAERADLLRFQAAAADAHS